MQNPSWYNCYYWTAYQISPNIQFLLTVKAEAGRLFAVHPSRSVSEVHSPVSRILSWVECARTGESLQHYLGNQAWLWRVCGWMEVANTGIPRVGIVRYACELCLFCTRKVWQQVKPNCNAKFRANYTLIARLTWCLMGFWW